MTPDVTVCIPAYKAAAFVHNAIESVLAQSYANIRILVSVDPAGDGTEEVCRRYLDDPRLELVVNPHRLGWVGNVNACLGRIETPFFMMCFHDDQLHPDFVTKARQVLITKPDVVAVFSHTQHIGKQTDILYGRDLDGPPTDRIAGLFEKSAAYTFKNLMRSDLIRAGLRMWDIPGGGYRSDFRTMLAHALAGKFVCIPEVLYFKKLWAGSTTEGWETLPFEVYLEAEAASLHSQIDIIGESDLSWDDKQRVIALLLSRNPQHIGDDQAMAPGALSAVETARNALLIARLVTGSDTAPSAARAPTLAPHFVASQSIQRARQLTAAGYLEAGIHLSQCALSVDPENAQAHITLAHLRLQQARKTSEEVHREMVKHAQKAVELMPDNPSAWTLLGKAMQRNGFTSVAIEHLKKAISLGARNPEMLEKLIESWGRNSRPEPRQTSGVVCR